MNGPMRRLVASGLAAALAAAAAAILAGTPEAQTRVLEACGPGEQEIEARALPGTFGPGECPIRGREISDGPVASVVPPAGESVHVEALTTSGARELEIRHLQSGVVELHHVGDDEGGEAATAGPLASRVAGECSDPDFTDGQRRVNEVLHYRINRASVPRSISRNAATAALRRGGARIVATKNDCRMGDRVPAALIYDGGAPYGTQVGSDVSCSKSDGRSMVAFGDLPQGILAATCNWGEAAPGYDATVASDIKINRTDFRWTTKPRAKSCDGEWDLEGVMTHERGHTFGLGHVAERGHAGLTMSTHLNGTCQSSERTLGRGDVLGLENKYD